MGRNLCENKTVAILEQMQAGKTSPYQKDGGEVLIAIVLDRPLVEAKTFLMPSYKITRIMQDKQNYPVMHK